MLSVIKLFIFFVVFVAICESVGLVLLNKLNIKIDIIALPIGMTLFGCLYEILVLPIQYFHLNSNLLKYALIVDFVIILLIGRKELKNIIKHLSKRDLIIIVIFVALFIINSLNLTIYSIDSQCSDNLFYIPFVNGISIDDVAVNGPLSNMYVNMSTSRIYAFYGQLHFYGAISNLLNVDSLITLNFFQNWYLIIFYITNIFNIYKISTEYNLFHNINKYLLLVFLSTSYLSVLFKTEVMFVSTTTMMFVIAPLLFYIKDKNKGWLLLFMMYSIHAISCRSTFIFLLSFFLLPYYLYLLFTNRFEIKENVCIVFPILLFLILYMCYDKNVLLLISYLIVLIIAIIAILILVKKIGNKKTKFLYLIALGCILAYFLVNSLFLGNIIATWDGNSIFDVLHNSFFDFSSISTTANSIYNDSYLLLAIVLLLNNIYNKKVTPYYVVHIIIIFILCLNRFVAPFISSFLPSVYERLFWTWINPLFYLLVLDEFICFFNKSKIEKIISFGLASVLIVGFSIFNINNYLKHTKSIINTYKEKNGDISYFYKVGSSSYEIGKAIDAYAYENNIKFVNVTLPTNIINSANVSNRIRLSSIMGNYNIIETFMSFDYVKEKWNEDNYEHPMLFYLIEPYRFFDDWHIENDYDNIPDIKTMFKDSNTDIFVINKWKDREETDYLFKDYLNEFSNVLYENDNYLVCVVK